MSNSKDKIPRPAGYSKSASPGHSFITAKGRNQQMEAIDDRDAEDLMWKLLQISVYEWSEGQEPSLGNAFIKDAVKELMKRTPLKTMLDHGVGTLEELENLEFVSDWIQENGEGN